MRHVITLAIPLCLMPCPRDPPSWPPTIHYGDCLDLDHLPTGGPEDRRMHLAGRTIVVWPCGGSAR